MDVVVAATLALLVGLTVGVLAARAAFAARLAQARAELDGGDRLRDSFSLAAQQAAQQALTTAQASFLDLARVVLNEQSTSARGDLDARRAAVDALVAPLRGALDKVEASLSELEASRRAAYSGLSEQVRGLAEAQEKLRGETAGLVTALRAPGVRGRWGELQLRRVVELAGLVEHCDFAEQLTLTGPDGERRRPDLVIRLPGGGHVVVDAKVPIQGYLASLEASDEAGRRSALTDHARQLKSHIAQLSAKGYWELVGPSPDLVVLFVPGDPMLSAALERDHELFEQSIAAGVLLATPTSLIALLRAVAYGWRQDAVTENAREVAALGRQLHSRIATLAAHLDRVGRHLDGAAVAYNETVGALESRVLVSARRFTELSVADGEIASPRVAQHRARPLSAVPDPDRAAASADDRQRF